MHKVLTVLATDTAVYVHWTVSVYMALIDSLSVAKWLNRCCWTVAIHALFVLLVLASEFGWEAKGERYGHL